MNVMALRNTLDRVDVVPLSPQKKPRRQSLRRAATPYLFSLPFTVLFLLFFVLPVFYAIYESLFRSHRNGLGLGAPTIAFDGLANYVDVFHDPKFFEGIGHVLLYGIVQVPVMLILALLIALLLDSTVIRFKPFFRIMSFLPYAIPGIVAALLWGFFYDPQLSPITSLFTKLGLHAPDFLGAQVILWSIANIATWTYTGYNMLIIFAALQAISPELYEAARMDGAPGWAIAWYIKIPLVAPALILTCIFSIIGTAQLFNEPVVLTPISINISSSFTPNLYAYNTAFGTNNYYYAAAISVVLAVITAVFSFGFLRVTQRQAGV
jgi:multiple sugar transport system permease protein